jgi:uncharacterized cupin superfamily protein
VSEPGGVPEAPLAETEAGLKPAGEGWFVVNLADAAAIASEKAGHAWTFEGEHSRFPNFGINVQVLEPGQPSTLYHAEEAQETFLVLEGECLLLVEEEERTLRQWDFFYAAPWTSHGFVGAGDGPCAILMVGARLSEDRVHYPVSQLAQKHGAGVEAATDDPQEAYPAAGWERPQPARRPWPPA